MGVYVIVIIHSLTRVEGGYPLAPVQVCLRSFSLCPFGAQNTTRDLGTVTALDPLDGFQHDHALRHSKRLAGIFLEVGRLVPRGLVCLYIVVVVRLGGRVKLLGPLSWHGGSKARASLPPTTVPPLLLLLLLLLYTRARTPRVNARQRRSPRVHSITEDAPNAIPGRRLRR